MGIAIYKSVSSIVGYKRLVVVKIRIHKLRCRICRVWWTQDGGVIVKRVVETGLNTGRRCPRVTVVVRRLLTLDFEARRS